MLRKYFDIWTLLVIIITFILFIVALFVKGLTQGILLEAGVFLVSVKLIISAYKNRQINKKLNDDLEEIKAMLKEKKC